MHGLLCCMCLGRSDELFSPEAGSPTNNPLSFTSKLQPGGAPSVNILLPSVFNWVCLLIYHVKEDCGPAKDYSYHMYYERMLRIYLKNVYVIWVWVGMSLLCFTWNCVCCPYLIIPSL